MISPEQFENRVTALYNSQKAMAAPKKWKSGKRAGSIRRPAMPIYFSKKELQLWLWRTVGLNAVQCPYCRAPIDILSLTLDHVQPRSAGGEFTLKNTQVCCKDCNERKGNLTHDGFDDLLGFMYSNLSDYDRNILLSRLKAANAGSGRRFFRDKAAREREPQPPTMLPAQQPTIDWMGDF